MILEELLNVIHRKESAHYFIALLDNYSEGYMPYTYQRIRKEQLYKREVYQIKNYSPNKYCYDHYWIILKGEK